MSLFLPFKSYGFWRQFREKLLYVYFRSAAAPPDGNFVPRARLA